jgi:hypothetical protein
MSLVSDIWAERRASFHSPVPQSTIHSNRAHIAKFAAQTIKELREIAVVLTISLAIMIAFAALDIWVWVTHLNH